MLMENFNIGLVCGIVITLVIVVLIMFMMG